MQSALLSSSASTVLRLARSHLFTFVRSFRDNFNAILTRKSGGFLFTKVRSEFCLARVRTPIGNLTKSICQNLGIIGKMKKTRGNCCRRPRCSDKNVFVALYVKFVRENTGINGATCRIGYNSFV